MLSPDAANLGVRAAFIFASLVVPVFIVVFFFYPEVSQRPQDHVERIDNLQTTGRTYVELDELYSMNIPARKFKSTMTSTESRGLKNERIVTHPATQQ